MPNIEVHGTEPQQNHNQHQLIFKQLEEANYRDDVVVTMVNDYVYDPQGVSRPFLRVIFPWTESESEAFHDCMKRLTTLNMDIELLLIQDFIPKKA